MLRDTVLMSVCPSFCKKYTKYRLPEMPPLQRKIVGSAKRSYCISPKLSHFTEVIAVSKIKFEE